MATTVICKAHKSHPATSIKWYMAEEDVTNNATDVIRWNEDGRKTTISSLVLTPNKDLLGKSVYCEGIHAAQITPVKISLLVLVLYSEILNRHQDIGTANEGQTAILTCVASGFPIPQVRWYTHIDGVVVELVNGIDRTTVVEEKTNNSTYIKSLLLISNVQPKEDYKVYICLAENSVGSSTHNITLVGKAGKKNSSIGVIVGSTAAVLLVAVFVIMLLILSRKGILRRIIHKEGETELDYVNAGCVQEADNSQQAIYEEIPHDTLKEKPPSVDQRDEQDTRNDAYMDLVPRNRTEDIYTKPDNVAFHNDRSTYADLTPDKESEGLYMKIGQTAFEFPRHMLTIRNVIWSGKNHQIAVAEAQNIDGQDGVTEVAIKMAKSASDSDQESEIVKESKLMKAMSRHPNIIRLLGVCTDSAPTFIVLEYLVQGSLASTMKEIHSTFTTSKKSGITEKQMLSFALDIAEGMKHLEKLKIVHRYLSPNHVLVDRSLHCKISNFGYASDVIDSSSFFTKAEGSVPQRWMAIESLADLKFSSKSDVWAFGVVLWHILTIGETPYESIEVNRIVQRLNGGYELPKPAVCGQKLHDMMKQCWRRIPLKRPKFRELASKLNTCIDDAKAHLDFNNHQKNIAVN
ncbi:fibroblast growth factor receptor 2-like [Ptychodera flava]|uniref:fibroblast growth factor receptor 2-like n=1 Tax=Ptychodera flava TaxID=63121 RepID=UPI00396A86A2